eukprot:1046102-Prymnesium_polylepis.1
MPCVLRSIGPDDPRATWTRMPSIPSVAVPCRLVPTSERSSRLMGLHRSRAHSRSAATLAAVVTRLDSTELTARRQRTGQ